MKSLQENRLRFSQLSIFLSLEVFKTNFCTYFEKNIEARNAFKHRVETINLCDQSASDRELQMMCQRSSNYSQILAFSRGNSCFTNF